MSYSSPEELSKIAKDLLRELKSKSSLSVKERMAIPQQDMPCQEPSVRNKNMTEVATGYTEEQAIVEANRCIQCKNKPCVSGCPVGIDIPEFIKHIVEQDYQSAVDVIKVTSLLPAICGRVCPQEMQCMKECTVGKGLKNLDLSVAIGRLERFVADWERENGAVKVPDVKPETGKKVGVVGSGPAGLVVSADVRREGHDVTLFEAFHKLGGVVRYGIPEFRLSNEIVDQEIDTLTKMGVKIEKNFVVGRTRKLMDLMEKDGFDALFIASGAGLPLFLGIPGEELVGVFSANEYLTRANLMRAYDCENSDTPIFRSTNVAVLGAGNVAMDAARMAIRLGAEKVSVVYRRTENEMPARREEVLHAKEEGIEFCFLQNAVRIVGDGEQMVKAMECVRFELGEPDASGRRRPVPVEGSEFLMDVDTVIVAIGNGSNPLITKSTPELKLNERGNILTDETGKTSIDRVYAGGDIVLGAATVILAMGEGRKAAASINKVLSDQK